LDIALLANAVEVAFAKLTRGGRERRLFQSTRDLQATLNRSAEKQLSVVEK